MVPVYDEEESLRTLCTEVGEALASLEGGFELIFVDDGSADASLEVLRELEALDSRVSVIALGDHRGQSAALAAGFAAARGELVATLDADLQNDPADIPRLMQQLDRADVVNGIRSVRCDSTVRRWSSRVANTVRNRLTGESVTDVGCSLRVMRASFLRRVELGAGMHRFLPTLLRLEGARLAEVPVAHRPRRYGRSKYGIRNRLLPGARDLLAVRKLTRAQSKPLF